MGGEGRKNLKPGWLKILRFQLRMTDKGAGSDAFRFVLNLQNIPRQILVLHNRRNHITHVFRVDDGYLFAPVCRFALDDGKRRGSSVVFGARGDIDDVRIVFSGFIRSGARKLISSRTRSMMVCRRRAPMFSVVSLTRKAKRAISSNDSGVNSSFKPSVSSSAVYCFVSEDFGSCRMRMKSSTVSDFSSTRMGKRPCSSGMRSLGLETWKAPAAMKRMWSVRTMP